MSSITVRVAASTEYDVLIEEHALSHIGREAAQRFPVGKAVLLSDDNVFPLYGACVKKSLEDSGFSVVTIVFPHGEDAKSPESLCRLWRFMAENEITRSDTLFALGGGVVGDLGGLAAATFLRGIRLVQIPTSLLAMVDSSVGGKTAVDIPEGKNLVGAFHQPSLVLCDPTVLQTLPRRELACGMAEVIKYAFIDCPDMLPLLKVPPTGDTLLSLIASSVRDKAAIVKEDERDTGRRQLLNLGHTAAHGIELLSHFAIPHGEAVAIGMALVTRAAVRRGLCTKETENALLSLLSYHSLPTCVPYDPEALAKAALGDKKRTGERITLVLPTALGKSILYPIPVDELPAFFRDGCTE